MSTGSSTGVRARAVPWRAIAAGAATLVLLGTLVAREIGARRSLRLALPLVEGRIAVAGPAGEIAILRDGHGVPHVLAKSERDAWFGLGFAQAQDRLAQLVYLTRAAQGRTAEVLGEAGVEVDRWSRTLGFAALGRAQARRLDADARAVLEAYAAGVSAWIEQVRSGRSAPPPAIERLGVPLEAFRAEDALAIAKAIAWGFDGSVDATLVLSDLIERLGGFGARPFFPGEVARELAPRVPDTEARTRAGRDPVRVALGLAGRGVGSSAWVVGARDSQSGAPLVAGDLHLAPTAPSLLYESHLSAPGFELAGAGPVGVPVYWSGHNERVAWSATHARAVAADLYVETLGETDADRYAYGNGHRPLATREERIAVRGGPEQRLIVRETHHGPLLDPLLGEGRPVLAVAWGGAMPGDGVSAWLRAVRAPDAAAFRAALAQHHEPVLLVTYADTSGRGGRQLAGWLPARNMPTGLVPVPGRSPWYDWRGRLPYDDLAYTALGEDGFLVAADNAVGTDASIEWWWRPGERAARIEAMLAAARRAGPIDQRVTAAILADQHSAAAPSRVRTLLELAGDVDALAPQARGVARLLRTWDGDSDVDSAAAAAWHLLLAAVLKSALEPALGAELVDRYLSLRGVRFEALLDALIESATAASGDAVVPIEVLRASVRDGLRRTGLTLRVRLGSDPERWRWGELHPLRFAAFGWPESAWGIDASRSWPYGGDGVTIAAGEYDPAEPFAVRVASVQRWIVDLAAPEVALYALVPGLPEHLADPLREEGVDPWLVGRPAVLATHRFLVEDGARAKLVLVPREAPP